MKIAGYSIGQIRKTVVAFIGIAVTLVPQIVALFGDTLSPAVATGISSILGILTTTSVFLVRNAEIIDTV